jgi:integrase
MDYLKITDINDLITPYEPITPLSIMTIQQQIINFIVKMRDIDNLSYNSLFTLKDAIISFYSINDIELNRHKISRYLGEPHLRRHGDRSYSLEEIAQLLELADERMKVVILLLLSFGMRIGAIAELKFKHLKTINYNVLPYFLLFLRLEWYDHNTAF